MSAILAISAIADRSRKRQLTHLSCAKGDRRQSVHEPPRICEIALSFGEPIEHDTDPRLQRL